LFPFSELNTVITSDASFLDSSSFSLQEHKSLLKPNTQQSVNSLLGIYKNLFHAWGKNIETMEGTIKSWEENAGLKKGIPRLKMIINTLEMIQDLLDKHAEFIN